MNAKIISIGCTDKGEHRGLQVFRGAVGVPSFGECFSFASSKLEYFRFCAYKIHEVKRDMRFGVGLDHLKIKFTNSTFSSDAAEYEVVFEGESELIKKLHATAINRMRVR